MECAHPNRVRLYHQCCGLRVDLSLEEARRLFSLAGMNVWRTGIVFRFRECPNCAKGEIEPPDIFDIHVPDSELEFATYVAQS